MPTPDDFRRYADECLQSARDAKSETERKAFLDMARTWVQAASRADSGSVIDSLPIEKPISTAGRRL